MNGNSPIPLQRRRFLSTAAAATAGMCWNQCSGRDAVAVENQNVDRTEPEPDHLYWMPIHFGPRSAAEPARRRKYENATILAVKYITSTKSMAAIHLPPGFRVLNPLEVTVKYCSFSGVDFMAGGGYNLVSVNVAAAFEGKTDRIEGDYCLVVWENSCLPILLGREVLGVPKIFADIPDLSSRGENRKWEVSENGHTLCAGAMSDLSRLSESDVTKLAEQPPRPWMGWKYIPSIDRASYDVSYPTLLPTFEVEDLQVWTGTGQVQFFARAFEEAPIGHMAASALAQLPVEEIVESSMVTASMMLVATDCRRLV